MNKIVKPKFLKGIELPQSYFQVPDPYHDCLLYTSDPYHDATYNGVSLLALSKYARSQNKRIVDLSRKEINDCCGKAKKGDEKLWREYKKSDNK